MINIESTQYSVKVHEYGAGEPLILIHANPGDHRDFEAIIPQLAESYRVLAVDLPGYGQSKLKVPPHTVSAMFMADAIDHIVRELALENIIFIGNSLGGYAAARLAIRQPDVVKALVLVSSGGFSESNLITRTFCTIKGQEWVTRAIATHFAKFYLHKRNRYTGAILERTEAGRKNSDVVAIDAAVWRSFIHPEHDLRVAAERIQAPTLVIGGRHDNVIQVDVDLKHAVAAIPNSEPHILDTGHEPFAEDPDAFMEVLMPFLNKVSEEYVASYT